MLHQSMHLSSVARSEYSDANCSFTASWVSSSTLVVHRTVDTLVARTGGCLVPSRTALRVLLPSSLPPPSRSLVPSWLVLPLPKLRTPARLFPPPSSRCF